jgi:hypothetical protein
MDQSEAVKKILSEMKANGIVSPAFTHKATIFLSMLYGIGYDKGIAHKSHSKRVGRYDKYGNCTATYDSAEQAGRKNDCDASTIAKAARGVITSAKGNFYKYI